MRIVQYKLLTEVLDKIEIPEYIYAFEKEKSIPKMALLHVKKNLVISLDIKDFFPSITQVMVQQLMEAVQFPKSVAQLISELCTYSYFLPQGALTSPKISNILVAATFGPLIKTYCDEKGLSLSIYADDITVSTAKEFESIEAQTLFIKEVIETITRMVNSFGFRVNRQKTKVMKPFQRQYVCGTVVNDKVNLKLTERRKLRAIVHNCTINGIANESVKMNLTPDKFAAKILGQLNWFAQLNPTAGVKLKDNFREIMQQEKLDVAEAVFVRPVNVVEIKDEPLTA